MADETNYANVVPIGEARARRERDASKWTAREMLLSMVADIDNGEIMSVKRAVVIFDYKHKTDVEADMSSQSYRMAGEFSDYTLIGMLQQFMHRRLTEWDKDSGDK